MGGEKTCGRGMEGDSAAAPEWGKKTGKEGVTYVFYAGVVTANVGECNRERG